MNTTRTSLVSLGVLLCALLLVAPPPQLLAGTVQPGVFQATPIAGDISANTTLTRANSPYQAGRIRILAGVTLTIEPGVEMQFSSTGGLDVFGTLHAAGTPEAPIIFTGATNQPGAWRGILVQGTAGAPSNGSILEHVTIAYGGITSGSGASLAVWNGAVNMRHSLVRDGGRAGLVAESGGVINLDDVAITNHPAEAVLFRDASANPLLANVRASGNGVNAISVGNGTLRGTHVWENAGLPYRVLPGNTFVVVDRNARLTVEAGVTVQMDANARLRVNGMFTAEGTSAEPIVFTGVTPTPGSWYGIIIEGTPNTPATAQMRYVTVEYGGPTGVSNGANLMVSNAQLRIANSIVRRGSRHGIYLDTGAWASLIETTQIVEHPGYAVYNVNPNRPVLASNNWWGAADGPSGEANNSCVTGSGAKVSNGVVVAPVLAAPDTAPNVIPAGAARLLTLTPQRVFATADGLARVWVTLTLRDGAGNPLPGRTVRLQTTRGSVIDGGQTDLNGQALAYVISAQAGDAVLNGILNDATTCEFARSAEARITFTADPITAGLLPESAAPYLQRGIKISPMPLVRGVPATISAELRNPGDTPITVEGTFAYAQQGIGLVFGPIGTQQLTIAPHSTAVFATPFTPPIDGAFCFRFEYSLVAVPGTYQLQQSGGGSTRLNAQTMPTYKDPNADSDDEDDAADSPSDDSSIFDFWQNLIRDSGDVGERYRRENQGKGRAATWQAGAPQTATPINFREITLARPRSTTLRQPGTGMSPALTEAHNNVTSALARQVANKEAWLLANRRYEAAAAARDLAWASRQASAADFYQRALAQNFADSASAIDGYLAQARAEGQAGDPITLAEVRTFQERLRTQGFNAEELAGLQQLGMDDAAIARTLASAIAADPARLAGDWFTTLGEVAADYRRLSAELAGTTVFGSGAGRAAQAAENGSILLARGSEGQASMLIANPFAVETTIDLRIRPIDLPPDWLVTVSPSSLTLKPGEQQQVSVSITPGTAVQGTLAQFAVEGYAGEAFVDGVGFEMLVPQEMPFNGTHQLFLPVVVR